jgi:RNA polymerase sigma factor (TIGR02999 family)
MSERPREENHLPLAVNQEGSLAPEALLPLVYEELRRLAAFKMAQESPGQTLQATGLVHEAYLRLVHQQQGQKWHSRGHFFAAAAEAMRRILVETARRKGREKHGGGLERVGLQEEDWYTLTTPDQVLAVDDALQRLADEDPTAAEVVKLRYFTGMSIDEAAEALGIHRATAHRHWAYARACIRAELGPNAR